MSSPVRMRNAVIVSAEIRRDLSSTTVTVLLSYGSEGTQSMGAHGLTTRLVRGIMEAAGVEMWSELPGTIVRVKASPDSGVEAFGHPIEEFWISLGQGRSGGELRCPCCATERSEGDCTCAETCPNS
jgi:hypothetical protein